MATVGRQAFVLILAGAAVSLDRSDQEFDIRIDKRTIPVVLGDQQAAAVSASLVAASGIVLLVGALIGPLPLTVALATPFPAVAAVASRTTRPHYAIRIQMIAAYPFGSVLFAATCLGTNCVLARTAEIWL